MKHDSIKKYRNKLNVFVLGAVLIASLLTGCANKSQSMTVEEEVTRNLEEITSGEKSDDSVMLEGEGEVQNTNDVTDDMKTGNSAETELGPENKDVKTDEKSLAYADNPFLGYSSGSESYDIKFKIQTDSGVAGLVWGMNPEKEDAEYYLWAIDLTRDIPRLYTSRRCKEDIRDEVYTNLDIMYPEKDVFAGIEHIVEISVSGTNVKTYVDSVMVFETNLAAPTRIGRVGTWVMSGDYHAYYDDFDMREGADGSGDYIYVEDFSKKVCILPSKTGCSDGRFKAESGLTLVPVKE